MGYLIRKGILKKTKTKSIILVTILSFIMAIGIQIFMYVKFTGYNIWYNSPSILICGVNIFELLRRINAVKINEKIKKNFTYISKISFGIFFMHKIIQIIASEYIKLMNINNPMKVMILYIVSMMTSVLLIYMLNKVKFIKKYIFMIKE